MVGKTATKSNTSGERVLPKQPSNHWSEGLLKAMQNPSLIVLDDDFTTTIKDLYPKSTYHYLVCCKENIPTLKSVKPEHLNLLKHMHKVGEKLSETHKDKHFLMGYHSVPSMVRLHLHVISDDFVSPYLKTKKHWNSFTTEFFFPSARVIDELESSGKINHVNVARAKTLLNRPLKCHKCEYEPKHFPDLKNHLSTHFK